MPVKNLAEDGRHGFVVELVDGDRVEVTQEARRHLVATSTGRSHRCDDLDVDEFDG